MLSKHLIVKYRTSQVPSQSTDKSKENDNFPCIIDNIKLKSNTFTLNIFTFFLIQIKIFNVNVLLSNFILSIIQENYHFLYFYQYFDSVLDSFCILRFNAWRTFYFVK